MHHKQKNLLTKKQNIDIKRVEKRTCWTKLVCITTREQERATATAMAKWRYSSAVLIFGIKTRSRIPDSLACTLKRLLRIHASPSKTFFQLLPLSTDFNSKFGAISPSKSAPRHSIDSYRRDESIERKKNGFWGDLWEDCDRI